MPSVNVRKALPEDYPALWTLFFDTIHHVNRQDYTPEQIAAWAPAEIELPRWIQRMEQIDPWVAFGEGQPVGFADLQDDGLVDMFFVHHQWQGQGIGKRLFEEIDLKASQLQLTELYSHVSITARPFFAARGFYVETPQEVTIAGVVLQNFLMRKSLATSAASEGNRSLR
ncbi:GNAT family N-acetyltransferase [Blastopirellula marina]|uniref:GNAT family N-acetyltransferase n=1 Tax=Blastopirellula marina TaxID=124 RepID=A0A2S8FP87_9BACT|nr:GNAT family N-acetyltransferase [Blastopirellula marina]PQO33987.1 GNAT family N-acetyltransferase [Blastopirellula marina]PTL43773.1 GNAT family N-acetyltransferase [Blastopirellula marina]